jgi:superfamily I DNA/RNA helicase
MPKITLRPTFSRDLDGLRRSARKQYQRASEIILELQRDQDPSAPRRAESRIPNCVKYELPDGYRLVLQRSDDEAELIAIVVGTHDHVDAFLDGHKGYLFDGKTGRVRELRLATATETAVEISPSADLTAETTHASPAQERVFREFSDEMLTHLGVPRGLIPRLRDIVDPDSFECISILQDLQDESTQASDALLAFVTGNSETRKGVLELANGQAVLLAAFPSRELSERTSSGEEFVSFSDPVDLELVLEKGTLQQWQLFLHPDQRSLVDRNFNGPARLRGISGSGKTVVALHRARRLAREALPRGDRVLFTTFDKGLANAASRLLDDLAGPERAAIDVTHLHRWCLDFLTFCGIPRPRYSPDVSREVRGQAMAAQSQRAQENLKSLTSQYVWSEIDFIMGRFLHEEVEAYLTTDRTGRGRALSSEQRRSILDLYQTYVRRLFDKGYVEPAEFVRMAYRQRMNGAQTRDNYCAVVVDEVQDISEIGLKLLNSIAPGRIDSLLLVGDTTQRIFTRGYSMKGLGIDISGRAVVLRKNYRNTRQILEAAFPLVATEWKQDLASSGSDIVDVDPEFSVREGPKPIVVRCADAAAEGRFISSEISALLRYGHYRPMDICVLGRDKKSRELALAALKSAGVPAYEFRVLPSGDVSSELDAVRVSSLHGAKGHEFAAVIIVGAAEGTIPHASAREAEEHSSESAVLYVGMTRARDLLYFSYAAKDHLNRARTVSPLVQRMADKVDHAEFRR